MDQLLGCRTISQQSRLLQLQLATLFEFRTPGQNLIAGSHRSRPLALQSGEEARACSMNSTLSSSILCRRVRVAVRSWSSDWISINRDTTARCDMDLPIGRSPSEDRNSALRVSTSAWASDRSNCSRSTDSNRAGCQSQIILQTRAGLFRVRQTAFQFRRRQQGTASDFRLCEIAGRGAGKGPQQFRLEGLSRGCTLSLLVGKFSGLKCQLLPLMELLQPLGHLSRRARTERLCGPEGTPLGLESREIGFDGVQPAGQIGHVTFAALDLIDQMLPLRDTGGIGQQRSARRSAATTFSRYRSSSRSGWPAVQRWIASRSGSSLICPASSAQPASRSSRSLSNAARSQSSWSRSNRASSSRADAKRAAASSTRERAWSRDRSSGSVHAMNESMVAASGTGNSPRSATGTQATCRANCWRCRSIWPAADRVAIGSTAVARNRAGTAGTAARVHDTPEAARARGGLAARLRCGRVRLRVRAAFLERGCCLIQSSRLLTEPLRGLALGQAGCDSTQVRSRPAGLDIREFVRDPLLEFCQLRSECLTLGERGADACHPVGQRTDDRLDCQQIPGRQRLLSDGRGDASLDLLQLGENLVTFARQFPQLGHRRCWNGGSRTKSS